MRPIFYAVIFGSLAFLASVIVPGFAIMTMAGRYGNEIAAVVSLLVGVGGFLYGGYYGSRVEMPPEQSERAHGRSEPASR
jgi:hypothetical protein